MSKLTYEELFDALKIIGPFEIVSGDSIYRTNPGSQQQINSCSNWVVGNEERSALKLKQAVTTINTFLALSSQQRSK